MGELYRIRGNLCFDEEILLQAQNANVSTTASRMASAGSEVSKILEERILGQETNINLEETGKVRENSQHLFWTARDLPILGNIWELLSKD